MTVGRWLVAGIFPLVLSVATSFWGAAAEVEEATKTDDAIKTALEQEIIGPQRTLDEVRAFTTARVTRMPEVVSVDQWQKAADQYRRDALEKVVFRGQAARWRDAKTRVEWLGEVELPPDAGYRIKKLRYESLPGLWIPALLYEPLKLVAKTPVVLNVNGHEGNLGKAAPYKQTRCINLAKRGLLALNVEWIGMGQLRGPDFNHYLLNELDLCGTSGVAVHYLGMSRALDLLLAHEHADPTRVAVAGLSGGGWQTIFISALDTRVTLANPVAGYSSFVTRAQYTSDLGDSEQTPVDLGATADYAILTAMLAPRAALLTFNLKDNCCFAAPHALQPLVAAAAPIYKLYGKPGRLRTHVNEVPGTHNFEQDNRQQLYSIIGDAFYAGSSEWNSDEIPCAQEIKSKEELSIELPEDNASFFSLAADLAKSLPRDAALPTDKEAATKWQQARREELAKLVHAAKYDVSAHKIGQHARKEESGRTIKETFWQLRIGDAWTVPAVELASADAQATVILVADSGRAGASETAQKLLDQKKRIVAVDPFYFGESRISTHDFLYALLVSSVGERPLGVQASQVAAVARWLAAERQAGPVEIVALGPRTSLVALVAAALETKAVSGATLHGSYTTLKHVIEQKMNVQQGPELFCFGLLERFDIAQIAALAAPRPVRFESSAGGAHQELAGLAAWYKLLGTPFDPLNLEGQP